jgi:AAHS family 4-hydroxybenzoate transporter-like MFS transporter
MDRAGEIDVGELLQNRPLGRFQIATFALCVLILFVDGLDYSAANVGAPAILRAFKAEPGAMSMVFGWGYFGFFLGSVLFGYVGDKFGRKTGAIAAVLTYSLPSLLTAFAGSLDQLAALRCLAGFGIGGVIPNTVALLTETAPKKFRVTFIMAAFVGYSAGNAAIGPIAAWFIPQFGWPIVFIVAGVAGTVLAAILTLFLRESIPFLVTVRPGARELRRLLSLAAPELEISAEARIVYRRPAAESKFSLKLLFDGDRRVITPLLWLAFFAESLTYITLSTWLAVVLERAGLSPAQAAFAYSYASLGAVVAILVVARSLDRFGPRASVVSALVAVASIVSLGTPGLSANLLTVFAILGIAFGSATHNSLLGIVGGFYPTVIRGNGVGYASGLGRIAAIGGPVLAGYLLSRLPLEDVLVFIAAPDLVVAAACLGLDRYSPPKARAAAATP